MISIQELEHIINLYRKLEETKAGEMALGPNGRVLADIYGQAIYDKVDLIDEAQLTAKQKEVLTAGREIRDGRRDISSIN